MIEPIPMTPEEEQAVAEAIDRVAEEAQRARLARRPIDNGQDSVLGF